MSAIEPELWWEWTENPLEPEMVWAASKPIALPLMDTTGDGSVNREDDATVVVLGGSANSGGTLVVLDPRSGQMLSMLRDAGGDSGWGGHGSNNSPAGARLVRDGPVSLVVQFHDRSDPRTLYGCPPLLAAMQVSGVLDWTSPMGWPEPARCPMDLGEDLDPPLGWRVRLGRMRAGEVGVIVSGYLVFTAHGIWRGPAAVMPLGPYLSSQGTSTDLVDLNLDGEAELLRGNGWYDADLAPIWSNRAFTENDEVIGFIPAPGEPARVVSNAIFEPVQVTLRDADANLIWSSHNGTADPTVMEPVMLGAIADFDGDGRSDVALSNRAHLVTVIRDDGTPIWARNDGLGSTLAPAPAFDFDGDGAAELVLLGPTGLRILDGRTGVDRWHDPARASTSAWEHPIIVDLDRDGSAELVVPGGLLSDGSGTFVPTSVWRSPHRDWYTDTTEWAWDGARPGALDDDLMVRPTPEVFAEAGGLYRAARRPSRRVP